MIRKIQIGTGQIGSIIRSKIRSSQSRKQHQELSTELCVKLDIKASSGNVKEVSRLILPTLDSISGKIRGQYVEILSSAFKQRFAIPLSTSRINRILNIKEISTEWDRSKATETTAVFLEELGSVSNVSKAIEIFQRSLERFNLCSGFELYMKDTITGELQLHTTHNMPKRERVVTEPQGEAAQVILRMQQLQKMMKAEKNPSTKKSIRDEAVYYYSVWNITDRTYWLEYGFDESVINRYSAVFNEQLRQTSDSRAYKEKSVVDLHARLVERVKKIKYQDLPDYLHSIKSEIHEDFKKNQLSEEDAKKFYEGFVETIKKLSDVALNAAYKEARKNIQGWIKSDPTERKHINLKRRWIFLERDIFPQAFINYCAAYEKLNDDSMHDLNNRGLVNESLILALVDNDLNVIAVISANNHKRSLSARKNHHIFSVSGREKYSQMRLYGKIVHTLSGVLQREYDKKLKDEAMKKLEHDKKDLDFTHQMTSEMGNEIISLNRLLDIATQYAFLICRKNGAEIGCSIMLIDKLDPSVLRVESVYNKSKKLLGRTQRVNEGVAGYVVQTKLPIVTKNIRDFIAKTAIGDAFSASSIERNYPNEYCMCFPLMFESRVLGVLNVTGPEQLGNEHLIVHTLSNIAANYLYIHRLSFIDNLTGLYNRKKYDAYMNEIVLESKKSKKNFSLIMLDIDHFKNVNDEFGHDNGDNVLASVGRTISRVVGKRGEAFRYGGEEITVILPNSDKKMHMK